MAEAPNPDAWRGTLHRRLIAIAALFVVWGVGIQARLVHLQVFRHDEFVVEGRAPAHADADRAGAARRHRRSRQPRARDERDVDTIYAVPSEIDDPQQAAAALCHALDDCSKDDQKDADRPAHEEAAVPVREAPRVAGRSAAVSRAEARWHRVHGREPSLLSEPRPAGRRSLGYVGLDNKGLGGIEQSYDSVIRGADGKVIVVTDAKKHAFDRVERPPSAGASIELTIDSVLQHDVERELARRHRREPRRRRRRHRDGSVDGRDPRDGERAGLQPERLRQDRSTTLRHNRAVEEIYEPGSTFKTVTASAALEEKVAHAGHADRLRARLHRHRIAARARHASATAR